MSNSSAQEAVISQWWNGLSEISRIYYAEFFGVPARAFELYLEHGPADKAGELKARLQAAQEQQQ